MLPHVAALQAPAALAPAASAPGAAAHALADSEDAIQRPRDAVTRQCLALRSAITLLTPLHMQLGQRSGRPGAPGAGARLARSLARMRAERERGSARRPRDLRRRRRSAYASRWSDASSSDSDAWRHQARSLIVRVQAW